MQGPQFLSANQILLTTLLVKLAVMAAAATIVARFQRFRQFLIVEHRPWPDRATYALTLGLLLSAGVAARLLLKYQAADLTLEGAFLAGLIDGPYAGVTVGALVGIPALAAGEWIALPFAIGCGFAGGGLRELCPKEAIWHFSPFIFTSLHRRAWQMIRSVRVDWQVVLLLVPIGLELARLTLRTRWSERLFDLPPSPPWMVFAILLATPLASATPHKNCNSG